MAKTKSPNRTDDLTAAFVAQLRRKATEATELADRIEGYLNGSSGSEAPRKATTGKTAGAGKPTAKRSRRKRAELEPIAAKMVAFCAKEGKTGQEIKAKFPAVIGENVSVQSFLDNYAEGSFTSKGEGINKKYFAK